MITFRRLAEVVRRRWLLIVACSAAGALVAYGVAASQSPTYVAEARLSISSPDHPETAEERRERLLALARSMEAAREAAARYGAPIGVDGVRERTAVHLVNRSPVLVITADGRTPDDAETLARALRDAALEVARQVPGADEGRPLLSLLADPAADPRRVRPRMLVAAIVGLALGALAGLAGAVVDLRPRAA